MRDRIYYEDQTGWSAPDYYALWRCFDRLAEYVGSTPAQAQNPEHRSALIQAKKTQVRDEELAAIDVARMPVESRSLLKAVLMSEQCYALAIEKFPNLRALEQTVTPTQFIGFDEYPSALRALFGSRAQAPRDQS